MGKYKKYKVVVSFCGAIDVEVKARNESEARTKGECKIQNMDNSEFIDKLEPQFAGAEAEELK